MEFSLGVLGWSPDEFWNATMKEVWAGFKGWRRANVIEDEKSQKVDSIGIMEDFEKLEERFPDAPNAPDAKEILRRRKEKRRMIDA